MFQCERLEQKKQPTTSSLTLHMATKDDDEEFIIPLQWSDHYEATVVKCNANSSFTPINHDKVDSVESNRISPTPQRCVDSDRLNATLAESSARTSSKKRASSHLYEALIPSCRTWNFINGDEVGGESRLDSTESITKRLKSYPSKGSKAVGQLVQSSQVGERCSTKSAPEGTFHSKNHPAEHRARNTTGTSRSSVQAAKKGTFKGSVSTPPLSKFGEVQFTRDQTSLGPISILGWETTEQTVKLSQTTVDKLAMFRRQLTAADRTTTIDTTERSSLIQMQSLRDSDHDAEEGSGQNERRALQDSCASLSDRNLAVLEQPPISEVKVNGAQDSSSRSIASSQIQNIQDNPKVLGLSHRDLKRAISSEKAQTAENQSLCAGEELADYAGLRKDGVSAMPIITGPFEIVNADKMKADETARSGRASNNTSDCYDEDEFDDGLDDAELLALATDIDPVNMSKTIEKHQNLADCSDSVVSPAELITSDLEEEYAIEEDFEQELRKLTSIADCVMEKSMAAPSLDYAFEDSSSEGMFGKALQNLPCKAVLSGASPLQLNQGCPTKLDSVVASSELGKSSNDKPNTGDDWGFINHTRRIRITSAPLVLRRKQHSVHTVGHNDGPPSPSTKSNHKMISQGNIQKRANEARSELKHYTCDESHDYLPLTPFARPKFPSQSSDRSPIIGLSSRSFLRVCFRIGEMLNEGTRCHSLKQEAVIELFARVTFSSREPTTTKQHFQFADMWHDRPPFPNGVLMNYKTTGLAESESRAFLNAEEVMLARCLGKLTKVYKSSSSWLINIIHIRRTDWEEIRWTKRIVAAGIADLKTPNH